MKYFKTFYKRIFLLLLLYSSSRVLFYFFNSEYFSENIILSILEGIRFDISSLFYINIPLLILLLFSTTFIFASMAMIMLGFAFSAWMISVPVLLQTASSENMRGRVMSLYFMTVLTYQLGWLIGGAAIQLWGIQTTLFLGIAGGVIIAAPTIILTPELRRAK